MRNRLLLTLLGVSIPAIAQTSAFSGPVPGFLFDPATHSVRAVLGSLGSASLGPSLAGTVEFAAMAPGQNYGIAVKRGAVIFISGLGQAGVASSALAGASVPDHVAWSDDGSVAVLSSQSGNWIQICTGFPSSIQVGTPFAVSVGPVTVAATDAHGRRVVVGVGGDQAGVYELAQDGSFSPLLQIASPVALSFLPDASALYALDQATNQISELSFGNGGFATWSAGAVDAIAIRAAVDNAGDRVLYVAGRASQVLVALDQTSHQPIASVPLSFSPTMIEPLGAAGFVLAQRSTAQDLLWTLRATAPPGIYFVPAPAIERHPPEVSRK